MPICSSGTQCPLYSAGPGVPQPQAKGPQGLEGLILSPIMHWRAFFILFHHFYTLNMIIFDIKMGLFLVYTACCD